MAQPLAAPFSYFADANGAPLAGGKVYTYAAGTTTPQNSYTDAGGAVPAANPVILDSAGRATIWLSGYYKIVVKDALDNTISTTDNITATSTGGDMLASIYDPAQIEEQLVGLTAAQTLTNKTLNSPVINSPLLLNVRPPAISNNASDANNDIDIPAGTFMSSDGTRLLTYPGGTIQLDVSGINGLDTGSKANSTRYYVYVIYNPTSATYGAIFTATYNSPTMPSGYTLRRYVGFCITDSSGNIRAFTQTGDLVTYTTVIASDVAVTNPGAASLRALSVPAIAGAEATFSYRLGDAGGGSRTNDIMIVRPGTSAAPSASTGASMGRTVAPDNVCGVARVPVDSSAQIRVEVATSDADVQISIATIGFIVDRAIYR